MSASTPSLHSATVAHSSGVGKRQVSSLSLRGLVARRFQIWKSVRSAQSVRAELRDRGADAVRAVELRPLGSGP
jgi:hypothetical protein